MAAADPVIWSTSRFWTVSCIQVPAFDTKLATDHQRMLRYLSERHGEWSSARLFAGRPKRRRRAGATASRTGAGLGAGPAGKEGTVTYSEDEPGLKWRNGGSS
ncbi:hypothetical protein GCM10010353_39670 [Streptomyces chryseus]|uniref:Uncharacterized protein n=1 Tax=Streptomyces chryseus TaxID=68186 RepID=A0ABQ3DL46_9ACTN|nr:hypothetical protein GCM10010353_39670 [Streptomyces chryseus]GHB01936.1 hypothetical protein GCM10010346_26090 [Streptomyces chryseus]